MWARIENGIVIETTDIDPKGRFEPSLIWVVCPADTAQGSAYDETKNSFSSADDTPYVPTVCTKVRGLIALFRVKKIKEPAIKKAIEAIKDEDEAYALGTEFQHEQLWERDGMLAKLVAVLGLTEDDANKIMLVANGVEG